MPISVINSSSPGNIFNPFSSSFRFNPCIFHLISTKSKQPNAYPLRSSSPTSNNAVILQSNSNLSISENQDLPTLSYLTEKCGLPLDSAISASKKLHIETTDKPDSVLQLFKDYNFTQAQISNTITNFPEVILASSSKLKPKFEVLESEGFSKPEIAEIVSSNSRILSRSFMKHMTPFVTKLEHSLHNSDDVTRVLLRWCYTGKKEIENYQENIAVLRNHGVPECNICKLIIRDTDTLMQKTDWFKYVVEQVEKMNFDPSRAAYCHAVAVMCEVGEKLWKEKLQVFKSFGWLDEDFIFVFRSDSNVMRVRVKKIKKMLEFYMNDLRFTASDIAKYPPLLVVSLEKRVIPRCSVVVTLLSNGFIGKDINLLRVLTMPVNLFEKKYLNKYEKSTNEVLKAYKGELGYPSLKPLREIYEFRSKLKRKSGG